MADTVINFGGVSSADLGFVVERVEPLPIAERKIDIYSVPGANGDKIVSQKAFHNVRISYRIWFKARKYDNAAEPYEYLNIPSVNHAVAAFHRWIYAEDGYQILKDSNDPLYYYEAYVEPSGEVENILRRFGKCVVTFNCKPQRFRVLSTAYIDVEPLWGALGMLSIPNGGEEALEIASTEPDQIYPSKPRFYIPSSAGGSALLTVNGVSYPINDMPNLGVWVDCEKCVVTDFLVQNVRNDCWGSIEFPELLPSGENVITIENETNSVKGGFVNPRWWTVI